MTRQQSYLKSRRSPDNPIPPANMAPTVAKLAFERAAIPLIPCPEVQPPAVLAPIMRATPPTVARATEICVVSMAGVMPRALLKDQVPTSIPRAKTRGLGDGQVELLHGDSPVKRHI